MTTSRGAARAFIVLLAIAALFGTPAVVVAHAALVAASPADGDTVVGNPPLINARYSEDLDPDGSSLILVDPAGKRIARGGVAASGDYPTEMWIENLPQLAPGAYAVRSTTRSAKDGDIDRTTWSFTVAPPPASPTAEPTPICTDQCPGQPSGAPTLTTPPSPVPTPSSSPPPGSPTGSGGDAIMPIIAALAIITIGAGFLLSRGRRTGPA